jgi:hypothetical protein
MVEGFLGLRGPWICYPVRFLCQCIPRFAFKFFFYFLFPLGNGHFSFWHNQSSKGALCIFCHLLHSLHPSWTVRYFLSKGVPLPVRSLHSCHPAWPVVAPLRYTMHVPKFTRILPFLALVYDIVLVVVLLLFAYLPVVSPLIELPLLRACPSNHGSPTVVSSSVLFPWCGSYDHDDSAFIPVRVPDPARLRFDCTIVRTYTFAW